MRTLGLVHHIETNGAVTSTSVEADSTTPALDVFRTAFGPTLEPADLNDGNRLDGQDIETISWGRWQTLNPITLIGANTLATVDRAETELAAVSVLAGPDSGFTLAVDPRRARLSRLCHDGSLTVIDPCISRTPVPLRLDATSSHAAVHIGATVLAPAPGTAATAGTAPSSGTPQIRSPPWGRSDDIHIAPKTIADPQPARPPQWWTFLIPIGIGVVLAVMTSMWWFLLFSVSAPLSGYVAYLVEKKRFARDREQCLRDRAAALDEAHIRLDSLEADQRRTAYAAPGVTLGFGTILSDLTIDEALQEDADHVDGRIVIEAMPIRIDPMTTSVTVSAEAETLRTMAFAWLSDYRYAWRPCRALAQLPEMAGTRYAPDTGEQTASPLARGDAEDDVAVDLNLDDTAVPARLTMTGPRPAATISLTVGPLAQARTTASSAPRGPVPGRPLIATLMPAARFVTLHRRHQSGQDCQPWPNHGLGELCEDAPEAIVARWQHPSPGPVLVGRGADGDVGIDLFADGPHALVAGTTGSGKSLLLQTWLLSMALAHPPRRLRFVLIDFKGGATFAPLQDLPHTDSVLDDFDSGLAFRALVSVRAEITRREQLLAVSGCAHIRDLATPPPQLVVVIDEFHALMATHPRAADLLEHLTALGRSLGVHLILATQRPLGVVTGQMKANINIRVCLRVRDETDSFDVIGTEAGALLPADRPGAACLDTGLGVTRFRVAVPFGDDSPAEAALRPRVRPWPAGRVPSLPGGVSGISVDNIITTAVTMNDRSRSQQVVLPPLPGPDETGGDATGIIDIPSEQRQRNWTYDPELDGSTILMNGDPEITDSVLVRMARAAAPSRRIIALGRIAAALAGAEISCGMSTGWTMQSVLDHLFTGPIGVPAPPSLLVCGNWAELIDSLDHYWADLAERLLGHGSRSGLVFLLSGARNATRRSSRFATQLIFPPETGEDGTSLGLSRQRFAGTWPEFRAVIRGPRVQSTGSEGADVQLIPGQCSPGGLYDVREGPEAATAHGETPRGITPRWQGLDHTASTTIGDLSGSVAAVVERSRLPIGVDAFGELVTWDPQRDGSVLTVRGSPQSGKSEFAALMRELDTVIVHDDAHQEEEPADWDPLDGRFHVLTVPTRFAPGYGSALSKAQNLGPLLVVGVHTRQDLTGLGLLRQSPLDGLAGTGWFATENRARAVRLLTADEGRTLFRIRSVTDIGVEAGPRRPEPSRPISSDRQVVP
ncbi:FtsK/SpoIIIE domain-containing protein [Brevibacterium atlanticum]|uniref:FtsK/SpoIIIE domain-containing protein n=1 Tax=Brevibacterium atlanticum TaxID=2697563 RepID=UPI001422399F|nr:FtsK/SpoIIIE domain-containing protein [Brevibacterium atlanticum]